MKHEKMPDSAGVYSIFSTITGDRYVGSSTNLRRRLNGFNSELINNRCSNIRLQKHADEYGVDALRFTILKQNFEAEKLAEWEQYFIDFLHPSFNLDMTVNR